MWKFGRQEKEQYTNIRLNYTKNVDTFNEVKHLWLHVFKEEPDTDSGEVAISHLLVSEHPLEEPLQVGLRSLEALTTSG